jgi:hypothetical protein
VSFEEAAAVLRDASAMGTSEKIIGPSSRNTVGAPAALGSGMVTLRQHKGIQLQKRPPTRYEPPSHANVWTTDEDPLNYRPVPWSPATTVEGYSPTQPLMPPLPPQPASPFYSATSPSYHPFSPSYSATSPTYVPVSPSSI